MRSFLLTLLSGLILTHVIASIAFAQATGYDDREWRFSLEGSYLYGPVNGYVQIPAGGEPGTTTHNRPKFGDIGINTANIADAVFKASWRDEQLYLGGQWVRLSGDDTLDEPLVSHGVAFASGASVSSDVQLDWYRFGYRHRLTFLDDRSLTLYPSIGAAVLNFSYDLSGGTGGASASRSFIKLGPQLGLEAEWRPNRGPFSIDLDVLASPVIISSIAAIFSERLVAEYRFYENPSFRSSVFAGVAFEQMRFEDDQTVSNEISADFGPLLIVGLRLEF